MYKRQLDGLLEIAISFPRVSSSLAKIPKQALVCHAPGIKKKTGLRPPMSGVDAEQRTSFVEVVDVVLSVIMD